MRDFAMGRRGFHVRFSGTPKHLPIKKRSFGIYPARKNKTKNTVRVCKSHTNAATLNGTPLVFGMKKRGFLHPDDSLFVHERIGVCDILERSSWSKIHEAHGVVI